MLLELGDAASAEEKLIANAAHIDGDDYASLVPLAKALREHECWRAEIVVYRALLNGILDRAYARAYGHAARYLARLREIAGYGVGLMPAAATRGLRGRDPTAPRAEACVLGPRQPKARQARR